VLDTAAVELVAQGAASTAVQQAGNDPGQLQNVVDTFTGTNLDTAITAASSQVHLPPDDDSGEQAALGLTIDTADISSDAASFTPFTIAGLELDDTGVVTFTDVNGTAVQINVNGIQTAYFADLSSLADGPITSTLAVNTDPVGNSFAAVAGNTVNLDQDSGDGGEQ
jgi:hypothetical protein